MCTEAERSIVLSCPDSTFLRNRDPERASDLPKATEQPLGCRPSDVITVLCLPRVLGVLLWINFGDIDLCLHGCSRIILAAPPSLGIEQKESIVCE